MINAITLNYPPSVTGSLWTSEIELRLKEYGGIEVFLEKAAYFAFVEDFQGYIEVSLEIFDNSIMPHFEENTISDIKYSTLRAIFKETILQLWLEINESLKQYLGTLIVDSVSAIKTNKHKATYVLTLK